MHRRDAARILALAPLALGAGPAMFDAAASRLRDAPRGMASRVDHVGSTAVPGLAAKPIIDIQIRDFLRRHPHVRAEYVALKRMLAAAATDASLDSRERHSLSKTAFVEAIVARATASDATLPS